jgi:hypothetical protein
MSTKVLTPQSVMDVPEVVTFTPDQQLKIDEIIKKSQGRAASVTRQELAAANQRLADANKRIAELSALTSSTPTLQLENKLVAALAKIAEHGATLAEARESVLRTLTLLS